VPHEPSVETLSVLAADVDEVVLVVDVDVVDVLVEDVTLVEDVVALVDVVEEVVVFVDEVEEVVVLTEEVELVVFVEEVEDVVLVVAVVDGGAVGTAEPAARYQLTSASFKHCPTVTDLYPRVCMRPSI
jgi:hypothetical protein